MTTSTASLARQLANKLHDIALRPDAGQFMRDITKAVQTIDTMINRPIPPRYCGPCPSPIIQVDGKPVRDSSGQPCGTALLAAREATKVTCHECRTEHDIKEIEDTLWEGVGEWLLSPSEILMVMTYFGEPVAETTFRRWRATGKLQPRGQRDGKPRYWPADVRTLRNRKAK